MTSITSVRERLGRRLQDIYGPQGKDVLPRLLELMQRYEQLGPVGRRFLDAVIEKRRYGKHEAFRILALLGTYRREDVIAALQRAVRYRRIKHLSDRWNTAVIVQHMAAGNRSNPGGEQSDETGLSLTGVIPRTRMQPNGFRSYEGDIKFGASGDDLVGGLTEAASFEPVEHLRDRAPMLERWINHINSRIRRFMGTDAEIEFTVERGVLRRPEDP